MSPQELEDLKRYMQEGLAPIHKLLDDILNGFPADVRARIAEKARRLQSQGAAPPSGGDPQPTTQDGQ